MLAKLVDSANIWVIQRRGRTGLAFEPSQRHRIPDQFLGQEFQSNTAAQLDVFGFVNNSHPSAAQQLQYAIVRNPLANKAMRWQRSRVLLNLAVLRSA